MTDYSSLIQSITIYALPLLFAIIIHEVAHGWVASKLGDKTALMLGRLTLNPIKHIDPLGTIIVPLTLLYLNSGFMFGWAKPVPINPRNFKNPKRDMAIVSLAGPMANFLMAFLWAGILKLSLLISPDYATVATPLALMGQAGVWINIVLMVLNLIPIPPLDGSRIVAAFLPNRALYYYAKLEHYGLYILFFLIVTRLLTYLLLPGVIGVHQLIKAIFNL